LLYGFDPWLNLFLGFSLGIGGEIISLISFSEDLLLVYSKTAGFFCTFDFFALWLC
jgi:hypothetical protein